MERIKQLRTKLEQEKGKQQQLQSTITDKESRWGELTLLLDRVQKSKEIQQIVAQQTQQQLEYHISSLVTLALSSVFDNPYGFEIQFDAKYGKTVCNMYFVRNGNRMKPVDSSGIGAVDIAAFGLRVAFWNLERLGNPKIRNVLILDEPFKYLRGQENQERCSKMVKMISTELGLQIIMTSDVLFSVKADRIFEVTIANGISNVEVVDE